MKLKLITATALAALALPAAASAHANPSVASVRSHVRSAEGALDRVTTLVGQGRDAAAHSQYLRNRRQTRAATRESARLRTSTRSVVGRATALRLLASQENRNAEAYAEIVDEIVGRFQVEVARAISASLQAREVALGILQDLVAVLPPQAQEVVARLIAALSTDGQDETKAIGEAMESNAITPDVRSLLEQALAIATDAVNTAVDRLSELVPQLPPAAQPYVQQALGQVKSVVAAVTQILQGIFGTSPGSGSGLFPGLPVLGL